MKNSGNIVADFIQKIKDKSVANGNIYFAFPPVEADFPCISFYQIGSGSRNIDDEFVETEFTFSFDIWTEGDIYSLESALDTALKELPYHVDKLGAVDISEGSVYRRNITYRFYWNY